MGLTPLPVLVLIFLAALSGCGSQEGSYAAALQEKVAAQKDLIAALQTVVDPGAAARQDILDKYRRFQEAKMKALATPKPPYYEMIKIRKDQEVTLTWARLNQEIGRIRGLPGGEAFLKSFDQK